MLAVYGAGLLAGHAPLSYEAWVSLWLNLPRLWRKHAVAAAEGAAAAGSSRDLDEGWADALALFDEQVDFLHFSINAERQTARVRAKLGFPEP